MIYITIEVDSGDKYTVRKPMGRIGSIHFGIITKYAPTNKNREPDAGLSPLEQERISLAFDEWAQRVLPQILINMQPKDAPEPVPVTIDDMSGEDQYAVFLALTSLITVGEKFFRIVPK
jgi:hypothetical protein